MELEEIIGAHNTYLKNTAALSVDPGTAVSNLPKHKRADFRINRKIGWWLTVYFFLTAVFMGLSLHIIHERHAKAIRKTKPEYTWLFENPLPGSISRVYEEFVSWQE